MKPDFTGRSIILPAALIVIIFFTACKKKEDTVSIIPTATTGTASIVGQKWATLIGYVNASNQICEVFFEYDTSDSFRNSIKATPDTITGRKNAPQCSASTFRHRQHSCAKHFHSFHYRYSA